MTTRGALKAITTQGALLSGNLLERLASDRKVEGLSPQDYHPRRRRAPLRRLSRSWAKLAGVWASFRTALAKLPPEDPAVRVTRERWLLPLFSELGFGRLQAAQPYEHEGRSFAISHRWERLPIHLLGARVPLDRRTKGVVGAADAAPHGLVQAMLNRADEFLWAIVSNGLQLRLLRDHHALARQAYVEFDLEAIFEENLFHEFSVLWLVCHQSRFEGPTHESWLIERWFQTAQTEGVPALMRLRDGVQKALEALGRGLLAHPANKSLHAALASGELDRRGFYRELLRLAYRLIFVLVAEDRALLLDPAAPPEARERYAKWYSTARLRRLANRRQSGPHGDAWRCLMLVLDSLEVGQPRLALPGLGSWLWRPEALAHLRGCELANEHLYEAVRELCWTTESRVRRPVNWAALESDELGSVYEGLMELEPELHREAATFVLEKVGGNERKGTGSYYTPSTLVECLLDASLDPLLDAAAREKDPEGALLALKVCDPACGSGHFLVAAARRIAKRVASVRTGDEEPSPEATRHALRDVVGRCIYGVDLNPMAVELCKVSLWLEAIEPGRPLSFLDAHIRQGNALLGTTHELMAKGVPDAVFEALEGDDKAVVSAFRKANKRSVAADRTMRQLDLGARLGDASSALRELARESAQIDRLGDGTLGDVREKELRHARLEASEGYEAQRLLADAWCAAFLVEKREDTRDRVITDAIWQAARADLTALSPTVRDEVLRLRERYGLFHWQLAFPTVFGEGSAGGFDLMLGNPPWDTLSPDTKEFFSRFEPKIRFQTKAEQEATIAELCKSPSRAEEWRDHRRSLFATAFFLKESGRFTMFAPGNLGKGDFNVYRMFVELALTVSRPGGRAAQVVPEGLYSGANSMALRETLFKKCVWELLLGFENAGEVWFKGTDTRLKFAIYSGRRGGVTEALEAAFLIRSPEALRFALAGGTMKLPVSMVREFSPEALAVMEFRSQRDIAIAKKMYARWPKLGEKVSGAAHREYLRELESGHVQQLLTNDPSGLPHYEGRMVAQYDHRAKGYRSGTARSAVWEDLPFGHPNKGVQPQWYVSRDKVPAKARTRIDEYRAVFCDVASPTNERALVATIIPKGTIAGAKVPSVLMRSDRPLVDLLLWLAVANCFAIDFLVRMKVSLTVALGLLDSLPFPRFVKGDSRAKALVLRVLRLVCTGPEMIPLWNELANDGWVERVAEDGALPGATDEEARLRLVAEIEAIVAGELFGLDAHEVDHVMEAFPSVKEREMERFGMYRTKMMVLDLLTEAAS
ncbi:MAG: N-6 DNA methylase [Polyangiales bacterium]